MIPEPGRELDENAARQMGDAGPAPAYSTDAAAADRLVRRLEASGVSLVWEREGQWWYCTLSVEVGWARERLAMGSGPTREIALCRAVCNLPSSVRLAAAGRVAPEPERAASARAPSPTDRKRREHAVPAAAGPAQAESAVCAECGAPLARAHAGSRFCPVCSYRRGRPARIEFEARRRIRRRRPPAGPGG